MCEGDDYWTDDRKLQKQVDYLEANPGCSLCFHSAKVEIQGKALTEHAMRPYKGSRMVSPEEIDRINILNASLEGMKQATENLSVKPNLLLVDGNKVPKNTDFPVESLVKGDSTSMSIAAASILAKVSRDRYMEELDKEYPQYQLAKHKGYPTKLHYELIEKYGVQDFYRMSFFKNRPELWVKK